MSSGAQIDTLKILIFDPVPIAELIESVAKPYLKLNQSVAEKTLETIDGLKVLNNVAISNRYVESNKQTKRNRYAIGTAIIIAYVDRILIANTAWSKKPVPTLNEIWSKYILPEYEVTVDVYELIESLLLDLSTDIKTFIGADVWNMHFQKMRFSDIIIEKCTDYRVHYYMQHMMESDT